MFNVAILCKESALRQKDIEKYYVDPLETLGITRETQIAIGLPYDNPKKVTSKFGKAFLDTLLPQLVQLGVTTIYCTDGNYLKMLAKVGKMDATYGYPLACKIKGYDFTIISSVNHQALFMNEKLQSKIDLANKTLADLINGQYTEIGSGIIHSAKYLYEVFEIREALNKLKEAPVIVCDTETFSLRHTKAGLGTIAFATSKHDGIAINVEHMDMGEVASIRNLLKNFFESYKGKTVYHNATYDMKILIYYLWMKDMLDQEGLQKGLGYLTRDFEDTRLIAYVATNTCSENPLGLKSLSHEYAGNYAVDVNDIRLVINSDLMKYNLIDCLATFYVLEKYTPIMRADNQEHIYETLFKPMVKNIVQMEMTGLPLNMERVKEVDKELLDMVNAAWSVILNHHDMAAFTKDMRQKEVVERNAAYKSKVITIADANWKFNPNSSKDMIALLHDFWGFPVLETTDTKQPATGGKVLKGHAKRGTPAQGALLDAIMDVQEGNKIRGTFVSKYLNAQLAPDGWHYLFGGFNIGGTKSGRLSSSGEVNLQNQPSSGKYGKLIKSCFQAPEGWIYIGLDYASLEDRINTLLTCDPEKVKIYTMGFDGHCYRTYRYWPDMFTHLPDTVEAINSIKDTHEKQRGKSKAPTFAMTYEGTPFTLEVSCGFTKPEAKQIYDRYHELYKVSDDWMDQKIDEASLTGYATLAFGLKLRCPVLKKTILGSKYTPHQASAERRTVANAVGGQSYGLLNSRAGVAFQELTLQSEHRFNIKPCAHIHDAQYFLVKNNYSTIKWVNDNLVPCVEWQDLPELQRADVKLTGNLGIFHPTWANEIELNHNISNQEIYETMVKGMEKYNGKNHSN